MDMDMDITMEMDVGWTWCSAHPALGDGQRQRRVKAAQPRGQTQGLVPNCLLHLLLWLLERRRPNGLAVAVSERRLLRPRDCESSGDGAGRLGEDNGRRAVREGDRVAD